MKNDKIKYMQLSESKLYGKKIVVVLTNFQNLEENNYISTCPKKNPNQDLNADILMSKYLFVCITMLSE